MILAHEDAQSGEAIDLTGPPLGPAAVWLAGGADDGVDDLANVGAHTGLFGRFDFPALLDSFDEMGAVTIVPAAGVQSFDGHPPTFRQVRQAQILVECFLALGFIGLAEGFQ